MSDASPPPESLAVTAVISRRVRPDSVAEFEAWLGGITREAARFPGYQGAFVVRPADYAHPEFTIVLRFDSAANLQAWEESDVRRSWTRRVNALTEGDAQVQRVPGMEFWFTPQPSSAGPKRWKMALVLVFVLFGISSTLTPLLNAWAEHLPPLLRRLAVVVAQVALMTYLVCRC